MEGLDKSMPFSEGMVDAEQAGPPKRHNQNCLNCGTPLIDTFCHHCGQKDIPRRQTLGELFSNFISSFWSYEGKFFLTAKYLITRPGFLATEYNAGRRESYYHPARMYVFISFVFFLLVFSLPDSEEEEDADKEVKKEMTDEDLKELKKGLSEAGITSSPYYNDSIWKDVERDLKGDTSATRRKKKNGVRLMESDFSTLREYDSAQNALAEDKRDGWIERKLTERSIELNDKYKDGGEFGKDFGQAFKDNFSKVLFYLLPLFALLLKLLYVRRDFFYSEHLVLSIYYYNFFYLGGSLYLLLDLVPVVRDFTSLIGFWIFFYLLFAMKRMYQQSWGKTIAKFSLFSFAFMTLMSIALAITAMIILMMM
jgi:Protein of unknown function (DUF3667)